MRRPIVVFIQVLSFMPSLFSSILLYPGYSSTFLEWSINGDALLTASGLTHTVIVTQMGLLSPLLDSGFCHTYMPGYDQLSGKHVWHSHN